MVKDHHSKMPDIRSVAYLWKGKVKVKVKVKLSLCLIKHQDIQVSGGIAPCILNLSTDGGEWSALDLGHFNSRERAP
jgi:hypothetical protein